MTGTVNESAWRGFAPGEVLFLGGSGSFTPLTSAEMEEGKLPVVNLSFNFDTSQNLYNQNIGGIDVSFKAGWDVMSLIHKEEVDSEKGNVVVPRVQQVDIIPVYQRTNFTQLGI